MAKDNENNGAGDVDLDNAGNQDAAADGQQDASQDAAGDQSAELKAAREGMNAEKEKRQTAETETQAAKDQLAILAANPPQQNIPAAQKSAYVQIAERLGIDSEFPSAEDNGRIMEAMFQLNNAVQNQQSFITSHPDYSQAVGIHTQQGLQLAEPLKRVIATNPGLASQVNQLDPAILHQLAISDPQYQKELAENAKPADIKDAEKAELAIKAAAQKASIGNAGGGGNVEAIAAIAAMSDEEFDTHIERITSEGV